MFLLPSQLIAQKRNKKWNYQPFELGCLLSCYEDFQFQHGDSLFTYCRLKNYDGYVYYLDSAFQFNQIPYGSHLYGENGGFEIEYYNDSRRGDSLISYFPTLITKDLPIRNHYDWNFTPRRYCHEVMYSDILEKLKQPKIYKSKFKEYFRIIKPQGEGEKWEPKVISIDLTSGIGYYNDEKYSDSCKISPKVFRNLIKQLELVKFNAENHFTDYGLDYFYKSLFEYKKGDEYYCIERAMEGIADSKFRKLDGIMYVVKCEVINAHEKRNSK